MYTMSNLTAHQYDDIIQERKNKNKMFDPNNLKHPDSILLKHYRKT